MRVGARMRSVLHRHGVWRRLGRVRAACAVKFRFRTRAIRPRSERRATDDIGSSAVRGSLIRALDRPIEAARRTPSMGMRARSGRPRQAALPAIVLGKRAIEGCAMVRGLAHVPGLLAPEPAEQRNTCFLFSNIPPFPVRERPAACSLPIDMGRPRRHSNRFERLHSRRRASNTRNFCCRGDLRPPGREPCRSDGCTPSDETARCLTRLRQLGTLGDDNALIFRDRTPKGRHYTA